MRISSNLFFQTGLNSINAQQSDLMHLYKQVGSGKRMVTPSDDPLAAAQAINVSQTLAMSERYADNREVATRDLGIQDNVLRSVTLQLQEVKTRLVEAGNGSWSDADRATMAEVLERARDSLLNLANSTDGNGQYLFSGALGDRPAFGADGSYQGNAHTRSIQVDQTREMVSADIGKLIFSRAVPGTTGHIVVPGLGNSTAVGGASVTVIDTEGSAVGKQVEIEITGPQSYDVRIGSTTIQGLAYDPDQGVLLGDDFGVEFRLPGQAEQGDRYTLVSLESSEASEGLNLFTTLNDLVQALRAPVHQADDSALASVQFRNMLDSAMQRVDVIYDNVLSVRSSTGARMSELGMLDESGAARILDYKYQLSQLEDLDYFSAITQLSLRSTALEAASAAFQKIQNISLFNMNAR